MSPENENRDGFALVSVLLFLLVVAAVITPFVLAARTDFLVAVNAHQNARHTQLATGLADYAARQAASLEEYRGEFLKLNSEPMSSVCGKYLIEIRIQDQWGLINPNSASREMLEAGFAALAEMASAGTEELDPRELAELALAYRSQEGQAGGADEKKLLDGFKFLPFEAIEELYEFPGFPKMKISDLSQVFSVHSGNSTVKLENSPTQLAKQIKGGPLDTDQYVDSSEVISNFYRVDASVRSSNDGASGFAGFLIELQGGGTFRKLERTITPGVVNSEVSALSANLQCDELLGEALAQWLVAQ